jgi:hypothetical protein
LDLVATTQAKPRWGTNKPASGHALVGLEHFVIPSTFNHP